MSMSRCATARAPRSCSRAFRSVAPTCQRRRSQHPQHGSGVTRAQRRGGRPRRRPSRVIPSQQHNESARRRFAATRGDLTMFKIDHDAKAREREEDKARELADDAAREIARDAAEEAAKEAYDEAFEA